MAIFRAMQWVAFVAISFPGFHPAAAVSTSGKVAVSSVEESSKLMTRVSYQDLLDLFGDVNLAGAETDDKDPNTLQRLVGILQKNQRKIHPLLRKIEAAFGTTSEVGGAAPAALGFLEVTGLPPEMVALRQRLLPKASELANLPSEELSTLEQPDTGYSIGWSHGRESFRVLDDHEAETESDNSTGGLPKRRYDTAKGSFYMNPYADASNIQNVYPPSLQPFLEEDLLQMTRFVSKVGLWIAVLCDLYLEAATNTQCSRREQECPSRKNSVGDDGAEDIGLNLASSISTNQWMVYKSLRYGKAAAKARLLYYFPQQQQQQNENLSAQTNRDNVFDDWCGWHTDHGTLTALLPGMLCGGTSDNEPTNSAKPLSSQGPKPGLYIKTKLPVAVDDANANPDKLQSPQERLVHVDLAQDSLGFQLGETLEILSGGKFQATPHAVKAPVGSRSLSVGRSSLAVFLQPLADQVLPPLAPPAEADPSDATDQANDIFSLKSRWRSTFGEFQRVTIESFS